MKISLKHETSNVLKEVKVGFSWTTLFFGFFPALFRGDWKWALIMVIVSFITFGLSGLIFPFFYNKLYIKELIQKGYGPADSQAANVLSTKGYISLDQSIA